MQSGHAGRSIANLPGEAIPFRKIDPDKPAIARLLAYRARAAAAGRQERIQSAGSKEKTS
jgi:hypothetical protein